MAEGREILREDLLQDQDHCPLDNLVLNAGLAYWPLLPPFLRDPYPLDWRCHILLVAQPLMQVPEAIRHVLSVRRGRHLVYPRRTLLAGQTLGVAQTVLVAELAHAVQHHPWIALCRWRNFLECHGYAW